MLDDHQPNGPKKQPASKRSEKSEHQESPKKAKSGDNFLPLVGNILFYRNTVPTWECLPSGAPADSRSPNVPAAEKVFISVFNETWNRLSQHVRHCLLRYWHDLAWRASLHPRPRIQIVDGDWSPTCYAVAKGGYELNFPLALIVDHADRLCYEIARTLAMVFRLAPGAHGELVMSMVEKPLDQWEKQHGAPAPKRKQDALEKKYVKVFEEQVALQVRAWGIDGPPRVGT